MAGYSIGYYATKTEATWGTSTITAAGDTAYLLGVYPRDAGMVPWAEKTHWRAPPDALSEASTTIHRGTLTPRGTIKVALLDGVPLWYAFGESANSGAGPYVHDLTFRSGTAAARPDLPSFTLHRELVDASATLTDARLQVTGLRVESCSIRASLDHDGGYLTTTLGLVGKQHDDTTAFSLTTKPGSRIASATPFSFYQLTTKTLATVDMAGLRGVELYWRRPVTAEHQFSASAGVYTGYLVSQHLVGDLVGPFLRVTIEPESLTNMGFYDLDAAAPAKDLSLVFTRGTNDTITLTGTNWHPAKATESVWHPSGGRALTLDGPLEILTCSVTDSLAGATHYA